MKSFSVRTFTATDGVDMAVLVDDQGSPLYLPNAYTALEYRGRGAATPTIDKVLRALGMTYLWASARQIDLTKALTDSSFLTADQMDDLALFLRLSRKTQDSMLQVNIQPAPSPQVLNFEKIRGGFQNQSIESSQISAVEGANRIRAASSFFKFHINRQLASLGDQPELLSAYKDTADAAINRLEALIPLAAYSDEDETLEGLAEPTMARIQSVLNHRSHENPFTSDFIRHRNLLMFQIFSETGIRRSELRYIKVADIDYSQKRLTVRVSKTQARTLPISSATATAFHDFVVKLWSKVCKKATKHGYLFITEAGAHLAKDSINLVFRVLRARVADLPEHVAPHAFRRTWNDRLSRKNDALPPDRRMPPDKEIQVRNRLMGWSKKSTMAAKYARRSIKEAADKIAEDLANDIANGGLNK